MWNAIVDDQILFTAFKFTANKAISAGFSQKCHTMIRQ